LKEIVGRWYIVGGGVGSLGKDEYCVLPLTGYSDKDDKFAYLSVPLPGVSGVVAVGRNYHGRWFDGAFGRVKLMPLGFKPEKKISQAATHKAIRIIFV
jgi:hypothetical protein